MSHFTVLVIGKDPETQLSPFSEHDDVPEYAREVVTDENKLRFINYYRKEKFELEPTDTLDDFEEYYQKYGSDWNSESWRVDDNGVWQEYSTYNPKSKWDYYQLGGRWAGQFKIKEGIDYKQPEFSWGWDFDSKQQVLKERRTDSAKKSEIENIDEVITFAVLKDGEWYEKGEMGWFGMSNDTVTEEEWEQKVKDLIKDLPDDTLLSVYDCHI